MNPTHDELLDHEYDGIREYDNPTPEWWHIIFLATVFFSILYLFYYHVSPLSSSIHDQWEDAQLAEYERIFGDIGDLDADESTVLDMMVNPTMMTVAQGMFIGNCSSCHKSDGSGETGANLTDDVYINVTNLMDVYDIINNGAKFGAMPAWGERLNQNERVLLTSYVASLRGKDLQGKPPEGELIDPWPALPAPAPAPESSPD